MVLAPVGGTTVVTGIVGVTAAVRPLVPTGIGAAGGAGSTTGGGFATITTGDAIVAGSYGGAIAGAAAACGMPALPKASISVGGGEGRPWVPASMPAPGRS